MRSESRTVERDAAAEIAVQLREAGYKVQLEPRQADLPFDLEGYRPDLVATRENGGLIVEIKSAESRAAVDAYTRVATIVSQNPGWRFLLVPADRLREQSFISLIGLASEAQTRKRAEAAHELLRAGMHSPALITAWSGIEGLLRRRAEERAVPVSALSTRVLVKQLYSQGLLSQRQYRDLESLQRYRNAVVHGLNDEGVAEAAARVVGLFDELLDESAGRLAAS
jgi:hypothetical protein